MTLTGANTDTPTFTAPAGPATLTFELTVNDGRAAPTPTRDRHGQRPPDRRRRPRPGGRTGDTVTLDGTGSTDPDGDPLTYSWAQTAGPTVTLTGANTASPPSRLPPRRRRSPSTSRSTTVAAARTPTRSPSWLARWSTVIRVAMARDYLPDNEAGARTHARA